MQQIISQFALDNAVAEPIPVKVGLINQSYRLVSAVEGGKSYFLQRINHHIFQDVEGLQRNIQTVTDHIRAKLLAQGVEDVDCRVLRIVPTRDGALYYRTPDGAYWRMYRMVEGAHSSDQITPDSAYLAGAAFAEFQTQLSDLPADALCETIPRFHDMEYRIQQLHEAEAIDWEGRTDRCQALLDELYRLEERMCLPEWLYRQGMLPKRINHCDTKVNNMLFDSDGKPMCIVDLDTVMPGFVLSDFGDFMRTAANTGAEDDQDLSRVGVNYSIYEAYSRGYLEHAHFLTPLERRLLPLGCQRMSYMQCVRFLADYLSGDKYYPISYADHNLVRAEAQFRLFREQDVLVPSELGLLRDGCNC